MALDLLLCFFLVLLGAAAKGIMDAEKNHYTDTFAHKWAQKDTPWGRFWAMWSGEDSWANKYYWAGDSKLLRFLLQGPLVAVTDLWHAAQLVMLTSWQSAIIIFLPDLVAAGWNWLLWIAILKILTGIGFEITYASWRSDLKKIIVQIPFFLRSNRKGNWVLKNPVLASHIPLVASFFVSWVVYVLLGGDPDGPLGMPGVAAIVVVGLGLAGAWGVGWYVRSHHLARQKTVIEEARRKYPN